MNTTNQNDKWIFLVPVDGNVNKSTIEKKINYYLKNKIKKKIQKQKKTKISKKFIIKIFLIQKKFLILKKLRKNKII